MRRPRCSRRVEGRRGTPRPRPPYPAVSGLWGQPTLINNVETFANMPPIIRNGGGVVPGIGTAGSKGTKVFALAGRVVNSGLVEVPMGISLRDIVFDIGGGIVDGGEFKAVQTGGPSGGCIPAEHLDMPVDYESLAEVGSIMGSGGHDRDGPDRRAWSTWPSTSWASAATSRAGSACPAGWAPCNSTDCSTRSRAARRHVATSARWSGWPRMVTDTSLCGLGQTAANPVFSTLRYFRDEYLAHIDDRTCPAGGARCRREAAR